MDFNIFFKDNIYVLLGILLYFLFNTDRHKSNDTKVIVIYTLILVLTILNPLNVHLLLAIFLFLFFFQYEILIDDRFKHKIISGLVSKTVDFLYLLVFKYQFLLYVVLFIFLKRIDFHSLNLASLFFLFSSVAIYLYIILFISSNKFELNTFNEIIEKFDTDSFGSFVPISDNKRRILIELEDKTFLHRRIAYNSFSFWIIIFKIRTMMDLLIYYKECKLTEDYQKPCIKKQLVKILKFIKRQIRGYSTIEMQLFRQVSLKDGYYEIAQRKIAEFIYSPLLFRGLKKYLKRNYTKVSFNRYKNYIIDKYIYYAPVFLGGYKFKNYYELFKDKKVSDCDFLFYILTLSSKLDKEDVLEDGKISKELIINKYNYYLYQFNISEKELEKTISFFNSKRR